MDPVCEEEADVEGGEDAEEEEVEVLREVLIEPQPTPTTDQGASEAVPDEDGWIEITSEGFAGGSTLESGE